jgi:hypothetical protein
MSLGREVRHATDNRTTVVQVHQGQPTCATHHPPGWIACAFTGLSARAGEKAVYRRAGEKFDATRRSAGVKWSLSKVGMLPVYTRARVGSIPTGTTSSGGRRRLALAGSRAGFESPRQKLRC